MKILFRVFLVLAIHFLCHEALCEELITIDSEDIQTQQQSYILIPSPGVELTNESGFEETWGRLRDLKYLYSPVFDLALSTAEGPNTAEKPLTISDVKEKILLVKEMMEGEEKLFNVVYTDPALMSSPVILHAQAPVDFLKDILYESNTTGLAFNPPTRVSNKNNTTQYLFKKGISELIGFLESAKENPQDSEPFHEKALRAAKEGKLYQVIYYWTRSYRTPKAGDDWTLAEMAKLQAWYDLNYPESRKSAINQLIWFIDKYGETPERSELLGLWQGEAPV